MTEAEIVAQLAADEATFAAFHRLRKGNSSRASRQAAWRATEVINERRRRERIRMHPIAPAYRWLDFDNTSPNGWTYPGCRTVERDEVEQLFPGAVESFDAHCRDIARSRFVVCDNATSLSLRLSVPMRFGSAARGHCTVWMPDVCIWRRYSRAVKSRPHREPDPPLRTLL